MKSDLSALISSCDATRLLVTDDGRGAARCCGPRLEPMDIAVPPPVPPDVTLTGLAFFLAEIADVPPALLRFGGGGIAVEGAKDTGGSHALISTPGNQTGRIRKISAFSRAVFN